MFLHPCLLVETPDPTSSVSPGAWGPGRRSGDEGRVSDCSGPDDPRKGDGNPPGSPCTVVSGAPSGTPRTSRPSWGGDVGWTGVYGTGGSPLSLQWGNPGPLLRLTVRGGKRPGARGRPPYPSLAPPSSLPRRRSVSLPPPVVVGLEGLPVPEGKASGRVASGRSAVVVGSGVTGDLGSGASEPRVTVPERHRFRVEGSSCLPEPTGVGGSSRSQPGPPVFDHTCAGRRLRFGRG